VSTLEYTHIQTARGIAGFLHITARRIYIPTRRRGIDLYEKSIHRYQHQHQLTNSHTPTLLHTQDSDYYIDDTTPTRPRTTTDYRHLLHFLLMKRAISTLRNPPPPPPDLPLPPSLYTNTKSAPYLFLLFVFFTGALAHYYYSICVFNFILIFAYS
jgi:hypothetical protein